MEGDPTVTGSIGWAVWFLSEIAFTWIPGTVATIAGVGAPGPELHTISQPVTVPDAVRYLQAASAPGIWDELFYHWRVYVAVSLFVSLLLCTLIIYCVIRIQQIRYRERLAFEAAGRSVASRQVPQTQARWHHVVEQAQSAEEQQWRLAVLEADIMLSELLDTLGYKGETVGDKMRQVERADFRSIDDAWEAHRFRNRIAHEGNHMHLDKGEFDRVIGQYQRVFREFHVIP